jgi:hypothetical protein
MSTPIVLYGLAEKRATYVAELDYHKRQSARCRAAIKLIDDTIKLYDQPAPVIRRQYKALPSMFKRKELGRLIVHFLRETGKPMMTSELAEKIAEAKGISIAAHEDQQLLVRRVGWCIKTKCDQGITRRAGELGARILWEIEPS